MTNQDTREIFLLKLGEVVLKGLNRHTFEDKLVSNVSRRLRRCGSFNVYLRQSTIYVEPRGEDCDMAEALTACRQVFGVVNVARAVPCEKDVDAIFETAAAYLKEEFAAARTFKVESKRADKLFRLNSIQISQAVGGLLAERFPNVSVDVHKPDLTVHVEVREKAAYVHAPAAPGAGGLPIGMGGTAVSLLSGGIDSPVSSWMMARRGVQLEMVHFVSPPYTSQQAQDKVLELARLLTAWCGRMTVHIVPFTKIQEEIRKHCPEEYFTLIMRRFMMRLSEKVARSVHAGALITGESLGQVASQTLPALGVTEDVTTLPVLRPLIGMDKVEIIRLSREIGCYETSILPYEDCCTVFTPRHPSTRPNLEDVRTAEAVLDIEGLVNEAMARRERIRVKP
ncbi:tRNA uracil 4-sulfurtransferase ThiI [Oscillibacter sp.]|uniref:tRNA uracil 4-sulfurtransferase ThiI n=1 Tax=Oscillibacter sp. TaxID=1945593 RepID=UPI0028A644EF|nr:tRNA uracil 4-sulfurtransferase ThiI [Oscillibacter sp.]